MPASLGYVGACAFAGIAFGTIQSDGAYATEPDENTHYEATDHPYSDNTTLQIGGRQSGPLSRDIEIDLSQWASLKARKRTSGTLNLHGVNYPGATLVGWSNVRRSDQHGFVLVNVTWYL